MNKLTVLANDPSLTGWGYVVVKEGKVIGQGCIKTEPTKNKQSRKSDDRARRISEINARLLDVIKNYEVNYIVSEAPHGSQSAVGALMVGIVLGIVQTLSDVLTIPLELYSEGDCKKNLLGKRSAAKEETILAVEDIYGIKLDGAKYFKEAVADALAVYHCATKESNTIKYVQNRF